jgi:hypothetical protein
MNLTVRHVLAHRPSDSLSSQCTRIFRSTIGTRRRIEHRGQRRGAAVASRLPVRPDNARGEAATIRRSVAEVDELSGRSILLLSSAIVRCSRRAPCR